LRSWWEKQAAGRQAIGDSDVLVSGHYHHHLRVADWGGCVWLQAPALDGGSDYWRVATGEVSQAGMLTFVTTVDQRVADISVL
jgi:catechol-2,3-dioxygenase